jgi:uncharacterized BrkB/YihY/UPF0761 family membrane protein
MKENNDVPVAIWYISIVVFPLAILRLVDVNSFLGILDFILFISSLILSISLLSGFIFKLFKIEEAIWMFLIAIIVIIVVSVLYGEFIIPMLEKSYPKVIEYDYND